MGENTTVQYNSAKLWQIMLWPGNTTINNLLMILTMFLSYVAVGGYGIAVATAGFIATYTRIFDGITDPLLAVFTDRMETRFGKIRIIMLTGFTIQILSILVLFVWGIGQGLVFYTITFLIYFIGSTLSSIATNTGNTVLTNDPRQRPLIFRWAMVYTTIIASFTSIYLSKVLFAKYGSISIEALQELCYTVVGISIVLVTLSFLAISEKDKNENFPKKANGKNINYKDAWSLLKNNRGLQVLIVAGTSDKLASQAATQSVVATMVFGIIIGNYGFFGTFNMYNVIPTLLVLFYATNKAGKVGTKKSIITWTTISLALAAATVAFMAIIEPTQISVAAVPTAIFIILSVAYSASTRAVAAFTNAMVPDIADYELYRSGNYMPGTVAAVFAFIDKTISSFGSTITALGIVAIGYATTQPQPGDPITAGLFWMAMFLWMGLPAIGYILTLIAMKWYPLDREMMHEIQLNNQKLRPSKQKPIINTGPDTKVSG
ncbi:MFS transporter [Litchfieldia salsa]|uniref:Na+/melibiose symporter n=1 Tax=Litchfieldia salsa TaxID=930152 RepID=A0A1H0VLR5_9BACI|nr:MFS transporter [Litchfieldia salsa]SDP79457.1 Na+/melibiose symporter [Litchfieldia salsa]